MVQRDRKDAGLAVEDRLYAVAVVDVDVDVSDALRAVGQHPRDGDGGVVVDAEAAGALGHGVVQSPGGVEGVLGASGEDGLGRRQRRPCHPSGGFVHVREDGVVARAVAEFPPWAGLAVARSLGRVDEALAVDEPDLLIGRVAGDRLGDAPAVEDAVGLDELAGQDHAGGS